MESEIETDISDVKHKTPSGKRSAQKPEKAEDVPVNWARKAHTSDRIPVPSVANMEFNEDHTRVILEDQTSYGENDFVFVASASTVPPSHRDDINYSLPSAFRIARIMSFEEADGEVLVRVNWFQRPALVEKHPENSRELYATFNTGVCKVSDFRGKCTVCNKLEVRNIARYCDKPTQFWFAHLYDPTTKRLYDILPVSSLKSLTPDILERLSRSVSSIVVHRDQTKKLCEPHRRRKQTQQSQSSTESEPEPQDTANKNEWPFRYFQSATQTVSQEPSVPKPSTDTSAANSVPAGEKHIDVPDWPGQPLVYYTMAAHNPASGKSQKLRLLEAPDGEDIWEVNTSLPWVQQMPKGYIARGTEVTATELSLPLDGIDAFVRACQDNYAANLDVEPHNLNFVDACCKVYTTNGGDENKALVEVSRFTRRSIGEPELTAAEASSFEKAMNPFSGNSWHDVFRAVETKPIADLSQYFWTQRPNTAITSLENQYWKNDPELGADSGIQCAICLSENTNEWKRLPGYVPIPVTKSPAKKALCSRCARLWYRYQINWLPFPRVEELENEGANVESELVEDAKSVKAEDERRRKRRAVAQEKKEALERKRQETKQAKAEAKAAGKSTKPARKKLKQEVLEPERGYLVETDEAEPVHESHPPESETDTQPEARLVEPSDEKPDTISDLQEESETGSMTPATTRRRPNTTQLTLSTIDDDFLNALTEDMLPELGSAQQNCVVCGQLDLSMALQTCVSCGLKVHLLCYGPGRYDGQGPWLCDCCVNGRSGLGMDTFYQCAVCPPKQPTYVRWLNGDSVGGTDVLKGTVDKTWCHLRCAVWIQGIRFLNPSGLDGIDLGEARHEKEKCTICMKRIMIEQQQQQRNDPIANGGNSSNKATVTNSTSESTRAMASAGICVTCDICHDAFHVSCAAEETYIFGFIKPTNGTNDRRPVIRCRRHGTSYSDLEPMSYLDLAKGKTVMQEYVESHKVSKREGTITAAERAKMVAHEELSAIAQGLAKDSALVVGSTGLLIGSKTLKCSECHNENAPYWLATNIGYVCPLCYRGKHWQATSILDPDMSAAHQEVVKLVNLLFTEGVNST